MVAKICGVAPTGHFNIYTRVISVVRAWRCEIIGYLVRSARSSLDVSERVIEYMTLSSIFSRGVLSVRRHTNLVIIVKIHLPFFDSNL